MNDTMKNTNNIDNTMNNNKEPDDFFEDVKEGCDSFDNMDLNPNILRGIYGYGFERPSGIQQKAIGAFLTRRDIVAQSQSGTGKTGAFTIGCLSCIDPKKDELQAIILSPTRELAEQTKTVFDHISKFVGVNTFLCIGGTNSRDDITYLRRNTVHVLIGTPGRTIDMLRKGAINKHSITMLILDEADELLSYGFKEQMYDVVTELTNRDLQICIFSATIPNDVLDLTQKFMRKPLRILVKNDEITLDGIKQFYVNCAEDKWKLDVVLDLYKTFTLAQTILYVNSRKMCEWLADMLSKNNYAVSYIHGKMAPDERNRIIANFRRGDSKILISTDLLARGIDVQQVSLIVNFELPREQENYIHRIGRSGRFGRKGVAINICSNQDMPKINDLVKFYSTQIDEMPENIADLL